MKISVSGDATAARRRLMLESPVPRLVTKLALPAVAAQLIMVVYNAADTFFVARIHTSAAAAVGVVFALMSILQSLGFGLGMGAKSIISRSLGRQDAEAANRCGSSALFGALLFGACFAAAGLAVLTPLLRLLGATETILPYARSYGAIILLGAPVICAAFVLDDILQGEGQVRFAMVSICAGGVLNALLDPIFIFTFKMGIGGAALATILSLAGSFLMLGIYFLQGKSVVKLSWRAVSLHPQEYWLIFSTGLPTVCRQGLGSVSSATLNVLASGYGDAAIAAVTIANKIYMLIRGVVLGIGQGMQPAAGYNFGAGDLARVRKIFSFSTVCGTILGTACAALIVPFAPEIIAWFQPDPEVVQIGVPALYFASAVMPMLGFSTFVNQLSQVLGFRTGATLLACCRQGIFFFPACILPAFFGLTGLAAIQPTADLLTFFASVPYQIRFRRKHLFPTKSAKNSR